MNTYKYEYILTYANIQKVYYNKVHTHTFFPFAKTSKRESYGFMQKVGHAGMLGWLSQVSAFG